MDKIKDTLVERFWQRVFTQPLRPAMLVREPHPPCVDDTSCLFHPDAMTPAYNMLSYMDMGILVAEIMTYLQANTKFEFDTVCILGWNSPEWVFADLAIQSLGGITVPIYPNTSPDSVNYIVENSRAKFVFGDTIEQIDKVKPELCARALLSEALQNLGGYALVPPTEQELSTDTRTLLYELAKTLGPKGCTSMFLSHLRLDDLATIIYTSGSTGRPKGVPLSHRNIACQLTAVSCLFDLREDDVSICYLPLAHAFERFDGTYLHIWNGMVSTYCRPDEMPDLLNVIKPTILLGVPAVFRKMKASIESQLSAPVGLKSILVKWAVKQNKPGIKRWIADSLVFSKVRKRLGGRLRMLMSGGAALSEEIIEFFKLIGLPVLNGYGMTEGCGALIVNSPEINRLGSIGQVIPGVEFKIVPRQDDHEPNTGVLWIRNSETGGPIFHEYFMLPEESEHAFDADGYFCTGDVVHMDEDGFIYFRGRAKESFKTDQAKYVSPDDVEKAFDQCSLISYMVTVGENKPYITALIFLNQAEAMSILKAAGETVPLENRDAFLATHPLIVEAIDAARNHANQRLEQWETVKRFAILPVQPTEANGLLTATLKIRKVAVMQQYQAEIEQLYRR